MARIQMRRVSSTPEEARTAHVAVLPFMAGIFLRRGSNNADARKLHLVPGGVEYAVRCMEMAHRIKFDS